MSRRTTSFRWLLWVALWVPLAIDCTGSVDRSPDPARNDGGLGDSPDAFAAAEHEALVARLSAGEAVNVLVVERSPGITARTPGVATGALVSSAREELRRLVPADDRLFEATSLPLVAVRLRDLATLTAIEALAGVDHVEPERAHHADVLPSLTMIGQPAAIARGADGRGRSVAVLDTGADYRVADLGACASPGGTCAVAYAQDFAPDDGTLDDPTSMHGTNVASIIRLVAPGARVLALDVFSGASASSLVITSALDWVITHRDEYAIAAVNMSLGYGGFTAPCPTDALAIAVGRVRAAGIVVAVASGNAYYTNAISSPACAPDALSVGAVDGSCVPASFSNSASFLRILAPGTSIAAGGVVMSGTSQATPHVAGAAAAVLSAYPGDDVTALETRLFGTGIPTVDPRNGLSFRRLSLDAATAGGATAPPPDITAPNGTFTLGGPYVRSVAVPYAFDVTDASGVASMCLTTATSCTTFVPYAASGTFTLTAGDGLRTVRAFLRDTAGNVTASPLVATTTLDTRAPTGGTATATGAVASVRLTFGGATDATSGVAGHAVTYSTGASAPTSCATGTSLGTIRGTSSYEHTGLTVGTTYRYRICPVDGAGNVATGVTVSAMSVAELEAPSAGRVVIAADATYTRTTSVTVTLEATDPSGVTSVCLSTTTSCTAWRAFATSIATTLAGGSGVRTVYAWFRDRWGNTSTTPASDTIVLDPTPPPNPVVSVNSSAGTLTLTFPEGIDAVSGLAGYRVAHAAATTAPACTGGALVAPGVGGIRTASLSGLVDGTTYAFRVCALDAAGNVSTGTTGTGIPAPEHDPPTEGSIVLSDGAAATRTTTVSVALAAQDPSGVTSVCLSTSATCTAWTAFAARTSFALGATNGVRTVRAWFRDRFGNTTSAPVSDTLIVDTIAPSNPTVTATARSGGVDLTFAAATDATTSVASYWVAFGTGTTAPACTAGTSVPATAVREGHASATTTVRWRVCSVDAVGNVSTGTTGATTPLP